MRNLEAYISAPRQSTILSEEHDSIHQYQDEHKRMLAAVDAIAYFKHENLIDYFVDNHLKSVLLRTKYNNFVTMESIHYEESKKLLITLSSCSSPSVKTNLLNSLTQRFNSSFSLRVGNVQDEYKNIVLAMFQDQETTSRILVNILNDPDLIVKTLGYELLLVIFKKNY